MFHTLTIALWLPKDNPGLRPRLTGLFVVLPQHVLCNGTTGLYPHTIHSLRQHWGHTVQTYYIICSKLVRSNRPFAEKYLRKMFSHKWHELYRTVAIKIAYGDVRTISMIETHQDGVPLMRCTGFVLLWIPFHILWSWETSRAQALNIAHCLPDGLKLTKKCKMLKLFTGRTLVVVWNCIILMETR